MTATPDRPSKPERELPTGIVRVDDFSVSKAIGHYPPEAKEATMWLAAYMRERCSGRRDLVVDQLRARLQGVTSNYDLPRPQREVLLPRRSGKLVGSVANLVQRIEALRAGVLLTERAGRMAFVETSTWVRFRDYIDLKRAPESVCKFGVIIGPTGGQKTECAKHYCALNNHGLCVHLEAPARGTMSEFLIDLAMRYTGRGTNRSHLSKLQMEIRQNVTDRKTIVIDNVQRLYKAGRGRRPADLLATCKSCRTTLAAPSFCSSPSWAPSSSPMGLESGFFEQFEGRAGGRDNSSRLDDFMPREDIVQIATAYGIADAKSPAVVKYLEAISRKPGRCRILFNSLQQAKREADARRAALDRSHQARPRRGGQMSQANETADHKCECRVCGEFFDRRDLDQVLFHEDHRPHPDAQYSGVAPIAPFVVSPAPVNPDFFVTVDQRSERRVLSRQRTRHRRRSRLHRGDHDSPRLDRRQSRRGRSRYREAAKPRLRDRRRQPIRAELIRRIRITPSNSSPWSRQTASSPRPRERRGSVHTPAHRPAPSESHLNSQRNDPQTS
jgi:hypothetical protein